MTTNCVFCDYHKATPLSTPILELLADPDIPFEDYIMWWQRLLAEHGTKDWQGVKIHMGRMHKDQAYYGIWPMMTYDDEGELFHKVAAQLDSYNMEQAFVSSTALQPVRDSAIT